MILQEQIANIIDYQVDIFNSKDLGFIRESLKNIPIADNYTTIISGMRRCGKSTLLLQLLEKDYKDAIFFNFEDIRLAGFEVSDFTRLREEFIRRGIKILFLDEIQIIEKWEIFVNQLLREGFKVFVTGSNASLLSKELGTHLTGRHLSMELFPFSYTEFVQFRNLEYDIDSLSAYMHIGGIPEYVKTENSLIINSLLDDILIRDIAVRHSIKDVNSLRQLAVYLISNIGNLVSANKLTDLFGIKSSATILEYFSFFKDSYLIEFLPQFSYSQKAQARNPKKVYAIDTGIVSEISTSFTDDIGHKLENLVYLHLRRNYTEFYYFKEKCECDFVVFQKGKIKEAVQVCYHIDDINFDKEYNGLLEAMEYFKISKGTIVTMSQKDNFTRDSHKVEMIPAYEYLSKKTTKHSSHK